MVCLGTYSANTPVRNMPTMPPPAWIAKTYRGSSLSNFLVTCFSMNTTIDDTTPNMPELHTGTWLLSVKVEFESNETYVASSWSDRDQANDCTIAEVCDGRHPMSVTSIFRRHSGQCAPKPEEKERRRTARTCCNMCGDSS